MMYKLVTLVAAALLSTAAVADDDKPMRDKDAMFKSLDRDSDQRLSQTEASGDRELTSHFASLDADSDGYLTKREYASHMKGDQMKGDKSRKDY